MIGTAFGSSSRILDEDAQAAMSSHMLAATMFVLFVRVLVFVGVPLFVFVVLLLFAHMSVWVCECV